jgi:hypothetical protein
LFITCIFDTARAHVSLEKVDLEDSITLNHSLAEEFPPVTVQVKGNWNNTIIHLNGTASDKKYSHLLSSVTFHNSNSRPGNPSPLDRLITMLVSDGELESDQLFITVRLMLCPNFDMSPHLMYTDCY